MVYPLKKPGGSHVERGTSYNQDRKYEHWLKLNPKNIEERNTNHAEASKVPEPAPWKRVEKEQRGENEQMFEPWENTGDGTFGEQAGRKPFRGKEED